MRVYGKILNLDHSLLGPFEMPRPYLREEGVYFKFLSNSKLDVAALLNSSNGGKMFLEKFLSLGCLILLPWEIISIPMLHSRWLTR